MKEFPYEPDELRPITHHFNDPTSDDGIFHGLEERSGGGVERSVNLDGDEFGSFGGLKHEMGNKRVREVSFIPAISYGSILGSARKEWRREGRRRGTNEVGVDEIFELADCFPQRIDAKVSLCTLEIRKQDLSLEES